MTLDFDLHILKSWDGDSPGVGPDRWTVRAPRRPDARRRHLFEQPQNRVRGQRGTRDESWGLDNVRVAVR